MVRDLTALILQLLSRVHVHEPSVVSAIAEILMSVSNHGKGK